MLGLILKNSMQALVGISSFQQLYLHPFLKGLARLLDEGYEAVIMVVAAILE